MILKIVSPKNRQKWLFDSKQMQKFDYYIGYWEKRHFSAENGRISQKNCDHNIDPWKKCSFIAKLLFESMELTNCRPKIEWKIFNLLSLDPSFFSPVALRHRNDFRHLSGIR
jgi:hypothetical protein